jgi:hypothetical protein
VIQEKTTARFLRQPRFERLGPGVLVGAVGTGAFLWRVVAWPSAQSPDAWAYLDWGGAIVRGQRPAYELTATAPKPLGTLLGAVLWPHPPERAFGGLSAISLGILFGALFAAGYRRAGSAAGVVALVVLLPLSRAADVLAFGYIDALIAALVALALAVHGRSRIAALILAGLARPEAWLIAGVAGFTETRGRLRERLFAAVASAAVAPLLWIGFDLVSSGDPLLSSHRSNDILGIHPRHASWGDVVAGLAHRVPGGLAVAGVGIGLAVLGFVLHANGRWQQRDDVVPVASVVIWLLVLAVETRRGLQINHRYLLPALVPLALGVGLLVGRFLPAGVAQGKAWVVVGMVAVALWAVTMNLSADSDRWASHVRAMLATSPRLDPVLRCGRVAIAGRGNASAAVLGELAAAARRSPRDFALAESGSHRAAVLRLKGASFVASAGWERRPVPLGVLWVSPACTNR